MGIALSEIFDSRATKASYHKGKLVHGFMIGRVACRGGELSPCTCYRLSSLSESGVVLQVYHILATPYVPRCNNKHRVTPLHWHCLTALYPRKCFWITF